jgi:DNA-binding transcriptional ArsR family regulator
MLTIELAAEDDRISRVFGALSDPIRRAMLARLAHGEATVGELSAPHAVSAPAISRHLRVLESAGLITKGRTGTWRPCRLDVDGLRAANAWMAPFREFFEDRFDRLAAQLEEER